MAPVNESQGKPAMKADTLTWNHEQTKKYHDQISNDASIYT